jgi:hypothetical protein
MASSTGPVVPPSLTVPNWYEDPSNATGCASDSNSGTSATCGASGVGPLLTWGELIVHRWGGRSPTFVPMGGSVAINVLSSQPSATSDYIGWLTLGASNALVEVLGTLQPAGSSFSCGAITQISRGNPGNDFEVAGMPGQAAAGQVLVDTAIAGSCIVDSLATGVATCTQPFTNASITTPNNLPTFVTDGLSWTSGDTCQLYTRPVVYMDGLTFSLGTSASSGSTSTTGVGWVQDIEFGGPGSNAHTSNFALLPSGSVTLSRVQVDSFLVFNPTNSGDGLLLSSSLVSFWGPINVTSGTASQTVIYGGSLDPLGSNPILSGVSIKNDTIVHGNALIYPGVNFLYNAHILNSIGATGGATVRLNSSGTLGAVWGAGSLFAYEGSVVNNRTAQTWANTVLVAGLKLNSASATTGAAYDGGGGWSSGISLTSANIDSNNGLQDPNTGARFCNTN